MSGPRASLASHGGSPLLLLFRLMTPAPTMHRRLLLLCLLFFALTACDSRAQTVQLTASNIRVDGVLLASGKLCVHPVDGLDRLVAIELGGRQGTKPTEPPCAAIKNGMLDSGFAVPDTALADPANVCLRVTIGDNNQNGKLVYSAPCVKPASSGPAVIGPHAWCSASGSATTCNFDNFVSDSTTDTQAQAGSRPPAGSIAGHSAGNQSGTAGELPEVASRAPTTKILPSGSGLNAAAFAGADFSAKVNACLAAVEEAGGGICDSRSLSGPQTASQSIKVGDDSHATTLLLPVGTIRFASGKHLIYTIGSTVIGQGDWGTSTLTCNTATRDGCVTGAAVRMASLPPHLSGFSIYRDPGGTSGDGSVGLGLGLNGYDVLSAVFERINTRGFDIGTKVLSPQGCTCYNHFDTVDSWGSTAGVNLTGNSNLWITGTLWGPTGLIDAGGKNRYIGIDIEGASKHGMILQGYGGSVVSPYLEANGCDLIDGSDNYVEGPLSYGGGVWTPCSTSTSANSFWWGPDAAPSSIGLSYGYNNSDPTILFGADGPNDTYHATMQWSYPHGSKSNPLSALWVSGGQNQANYGVTGHAPISVGEIASLGGGAFSGRHSVTALANPSAPTIANVGTAGSSTYQYRVVCHDWNGGVTQASSAGQTTTGNIKLSSTNYNVVAPDCPDGTESLDILKYVSGAWRALFLNQFGNGVKRYFPYKDTGQSTITYALPTRNSTADFSVAGRLSIGSNVVIPETVHGYQGSSGTKLQLAKGDAIAGHCAEFATDGSLEDSGVACATGRGPSSHAVATPEEHSAGATPKTSIGVLAAHSTNTGGAITGLSAETSVTLTFANDGWKNAAFCVASASVALQSAPYVSSISAKKVTFRFPQLTGTLYYHCDGN